MRVALYARYSSDLQDVRSITDQFVLAAERATRENWQIVAKFEDAAISGATIINRPGLLSLMGAAERHEFDIVICESLDRLSRDQEDIAGLYKRLSFWNVRIFTLADGDISPIHIGLKGTMAALFLADLAQKTRRGQIGRVKAGRIPGGRCYGYDVVRDSEERGKRTINKFEAETIRRIFTDYVAGLTPYQITSQLNKEGVPGPRGNQWNASTINGSRKRRNGILNNDLYVGQLVYNRQSFVKDPITGKRQARPNPESEWITQGVPELRILDNDLWAQAQARRKEKSFTRPEHANKPKRVLSGLLSCSCCGSSYILYNRNKVACSARVNKGTCDNRHIYSIDKIERRVFSGLKNYLLEPDAITEAIGEYRAEMKRLTADIRKKRSRIERELGEITRRETRIVDAIADGIGDRKPLLIKLDRLGKRRKEIDIELARADNPPNVELHPSAADLYRQKVEHMQEALASGDALLRNEAFAAIRALIRKIIIHPHDKGYDLEIHGDLATLLNDRNDRVANRQVAMVAGVGFEPTTFRL